MKREGSFKAKLVQLFPFRKFRGKRTIIVECYGGLGNQTLAMLAGSHLCMPLGARLVIDCLYTKKNHLNTFDFLKFEWPLQFELRNEKQSRFAKKVWMILDSLSFRFGAWRRVEMAYLGIIREKWTSMPELKLIAEGFGRRSSYRLKGFWLQKHCIESLQSQNFLREMKVLEPSPALKEYMSICEVVKPIAFHVRRGDYTKNDFGQLDEEYYLKVLKGLELNQAADVSIWAFVESQEILEEMPNLKLIVNQVITQSSLPDPAENIILLSRCRVLVLSNSSFSYVAGLTSKNEVHAPWPLRPKNREVSPGVVDPKQEDIYPNTWKITSSIWSE